MRTCEQTKGQSVLEHGLSVKRKTFELLDHLEKGVPLKSDWNIPDWIYTNKKYILDNLVDRKTIKEYTILHDCGKPYCIQYDDEGKRHFPNHAQVSADVYSSFSENSVIRNLILHDMDIHLLRAEDDLKFASMPNPITHIVVGLAELHANAEMFGGIESDSFKIKWKRINKRGRSILEILTKNL